MPIKSNQNSELSRTATSIAEQIPRGKNKSGAEYSVKTYQGKVHINKDQKINSGRLDGFWLLVTNHNKRLNNNYLMPATKAIQPYQDKVVIESAFRDIKSFVEIAPIHVWTNEHVKAHFTICVLAYLINRTITLKLHKNAGEKTRDIVAHERLYSALSRCQISRVNINNRNLSFYKMTDISEKQKELLSRLKMDHLCVPKIIEDMNAVGGDTT